MIAKSITIIFKLEIWRFVDRTHFIQLHLKNDLLIATFLKRGCNVIIFFNKKKYNKEKETTGGGWSGDLELVISVRLYCLDGSSLIDDNFRVVANSPSYNDTSWDDVPGYGFVALSNPTTRTSVSIRTCTDLPVCVVDYLRIGGRRSIHFQCHVARYWITGAEWKVL